MLVESQNCQIWAKWLRCTGGATVMSFGSSASNIWPELTPLGHLRGMGWESGCSVCILCTKSNNNMVKNALFLSVCNWLCEWDLRKKRTEEERKRIKHLKERRERMSHFSASTTHLACNTFGIHSQEFGKSDSHVLLILPPQQCTL